MKILFLDFDGVLNSEKYVRQSKEYGILIDPSRMLLLKRIIDKTNAEIVLSTSWREHWSRNTGECDDIGRQINDIFAKYGLFVFDKTEKLNTRRENEIENWLFEHKECVNFVVLDDNFLSAEFLKGHFVKTSNYRNGLDEAEVRKAIDILNR